MNIPRQINSRRVGSLWHRDVLISASEIMERNLSEGGGRESEREREPERENSIKQKKSQNSFVINNLTPSKILKY